MIDDHIAQRELSPSRDKILPCECLVKAPFQRDNDLLTLVLSHSALMHKLVEWGEPSSYVLGLRRLGEIHHELESSRNLILEPYLRSQLNTPGDCLQRLIKCAVLSLTRCHEVRIDSDQPVTIEGSETMRVSFRTPTLNLRSEPAIVAVVASRQVPPTFSAGIPDVPLPFDSDRKLLAWVFYRAINSASPVIGWEYRKELGLKRSGKNKRDLRARFHRISGLDINTERKHSSGITGKNFPNCAVRNQS